MDNKKEQDRIIGVIGLGYVGLPLSLAFSDFFQVVGFDNNYQRVQELNNGIDRNGDLVFNKNNNISFSNSEDDISVCNIYIVTVPTPVTPDNIPDLSFVKNATQIIGKYLCAGNIVIYESTVYPGVTEDICAPILEKVSSLKFNVDFFCGFSPERISPGDPDFSLKNVVKITSGSNSKIATEIDELYKNIIIAGTCKVSSIKIAEAAKVVENTQRDVNIALINELSMMFDLMDIDTNQVLDAAKTKHNFLDFKPGLVGGHCIGVDPYYLSYQSEKLGFKPNLILTARKINDNMSVFIVEKTIKLLSEYNKKLKNASILILGYTFKENCKDTRNTKVKDIVLGLQNNLCEVLVYDPYIDEKKDNIFIKDPFQESLKRFDAIILAVSHNEFLKYTIGDFQRISKGKLVFLDLKSLFLESNWKL